MQPSRKAHIQFPRTRSLSSKFILSCSSHRKRWKRQPSISDVSTAQCCRGEHDFNALKCQIILNLNFWCTLPMALNDFNALKCHMILILNFWCTLPIALNRDYITFACSDSLAQDYLNRQKWCHHGSIMRSESETSRRLKPESREAHHRGPCNFKWSEMWASML